NQWCYYVLAIMFNVLRRINVDKIQLFKENQHASNLSQFIYFNTTTSSLDILVKNEQKQRKEKNNSSRSRHPAFGGTVVKTVDDSNQIIVNPKSNVNHQSIQDGKKQIKKTLKQQENVVINCYYDIPADLWQFINEFCNDFLLLSFNPMYQKIINHSVDSDVPKSGCHFLWLLRQALTIETFNSVYHLIIEFLDKLDIDRKNVSDHICNINYAILVYHELYQYLNIMSLSSDTNLNHISEIFSEKIFYVSEYKDVFLTVFKKYRRDYYPLEFLRNLFMTFFLFFQSLKQFYTKKGAFLVQVKRKLITINKSKNTPNWESIFISLQNIDFQLLNDFEPIQCNLNIPFENQLFDVKLNIRDFLTCGEYKAAITTYYAMMDFTGKEQKEKVEILKDLEKIYYINRNNKANDDLKDSESPEFVDQELFSDAESVTEKQFDLNKYFSRYACLSMSKICSRLLKNFEENEQILNDSVGIFMHYVAFNLKFPQLFYHISYFRVFLRIFEESDKYV
ncbi:hypothetical protein MXB_1941, partial [Myxobolus squamalis]